jgi:hypothetical protein
MAKLGVLTAYETTPEINLILRWGRCKSNFLKISESKFSSSRI